MANTVNVGATLRFTAGVQSQGLTPSPNYTQAGSHAFSDVQDVNTTAVALATSDLANLKYCCLYNPSDSAQTLTVTCAAQVLAPGDACLIRASSTAVTLAATGALSVACAGAEA